MTEPVLTERTAKKWKGLQVIGVVACLIGLICMMVGARVVGIPLAIAGLIVVIFARSQAWWRHS